MTESGEAQPREITRSPERKILKSSGEMARSLDFAFKINDGLAWYGKPLEVPSGSGEELLVVDHLPVNTGYQRISVGVGLTEAMRETMHDLDTLMPTEQYEALPRLRPSETALSAAELRRGGYNKIADFIRTVEDSGLLQKELAALMVEYRQGLVVVPQVIEAIRALLPEYARIVVNKYPEKGKLYFAEASPIKGRKSHRTIRVSVGASYVGAVLAPAQAKIDSTTGQISLDTDKFDEGRVTYLLSMEQEKELGKIKTTDPAEIKRIVDEYFQKVADALKLPK